MRIRSLVVAVLAPLTMMVVPAQAQVGPAAERLEWSVAGLEAPAHILIDQWGVPHIFAGSARDAFFLQGYNAARDRLWQIDLWRKRGLGRLSASLGPDYVAQDRAARLLLYRGDMAAEWAAYAPDARDIVTAWVAGVNAYVAEVRAGDKPLPVEFTLTGSAPETWAADDVLRIRSHALVSNVASEVIRARTVCAGGLKAEQLRRKLEPEHTLKVPAGLDPCSIPADVLSDYLLGTQSVSFDALAKSSRAALDPETRLAMAMEAASLEGSNNWTVAPAKSETGRPILANDPHRQLTTPSLRYIVAMHAPGLDLMGAGEPALPGISLGHNADVAFGITIFAIDQEDLYVYRLNPNDPDRYRYKSTWEPMTVLRETIEVKGGAPQEVELRYTRHGPVLKHDPATGQAFALRTVWSEPGVSGYFGSSRLFRAKNWDDFKAASHAWGAPPLNLVYADTSGEVGWAASGKTPIRQNWDGLMPVPGDGRYEWKGFQPKDTLPSVKNPEKGFFATANEMNLPANFPKDKRPALEWADPSRTQRIHAVLGGEDKISLRESMALQTDSVSMQARRGVALLRGLASDDADMARALDLLRAWNGDETTESVAAAIYEVWSAKHLGKEIVTRVTPAGAQALVGNGALEAVITYLEGPAKELGGPDGAARREALLASLSAALSELRERLGPDMTTWRWGRLHQAKWEPAIAMLADPQLKSQLTVGPLPTPGSGSTPRAQGYSPADFSVVSGASVRFVMDVGAWDNSMMINAPGQSADPSSPHYRDLFPHWAKGEYVPMRFSRPAVERDTRTAIRLTPKP